MERGKISIEHNESGSVKVMIETVGGTVWLTKNEIARLFDVFVPTVSGNLRVIFKNKELFETEVTRYHNEVMYYNLDVVISLAFRMKGGFCRAFREWLREQAKRPIIESRQQPIVIQLSNSTFIKN